MPSARPGRAYRRGMLPTGQRLRYLETPTDRGHAVPDPEPADAPAPAHRPPDPALHAPYWGMAMIDFPAWVKVTPCAWRSRSGHAQTANGVRRTYWREAVER